MTPDQVAYQQDQLRREWARQQQAAARLRLAQAEASDRFWSRLVVLLAVIVIFEGAYLISLVLW